MKKDRLPFWTFYFFLLFILALTNTTVFANSTQEETSEGPTPAIEASTYPVKVLARSNSNRIYLFEDPLSKEPLAGHLILLKDEGQISIMALRVLKTYPEQKLFAAKFIKHYPDIEILEEGQVFTAVEKVMDLMPPPTLSADEVDLTRLEEQRANLLQPPLNVSNSAPQPQKTLGRRSIASSNTEITIQNRNPRLTHSEEAADEEDDSSTDALTLATSKNFDRYSSWLSAGLGVIRSNVPLGGGQSQYLNAVVGRFGITLGHPGIIHGPKIQDALVLEGSVFGFKVIGSAGDSYTLVSLVPTLRYTLALGEFLSIFGYVGAAGNLPIAAANANVLTLTNLQSIFPAAGAGLLFQIGPGWYTRLDGGLESVALNLTLRF
jgi:hypothetical protein